MPERQSQSDPRRRLSGVLSAQARLPAAEAIQIGRQVARAARALHDSGQAHRRICADTVLLDAASTATLAPPRPEESFGGADSDVELCPPELQTSAGVIVPSRLEQAQAVFEREAIPLDPRRIDTYQLGTLLARLVTGESVEVYLRSPKGKRKLPGMLRPIVDRAIGFNPKDRYTQPADLLAALDALDDADPCTRAEPEEPVPEGPDADLPFHILGHYRILARIGQGGMGDVYRAYEESLDRTVAIKVLPSELARHEDFVRRFRSEATAAARLVHPNVVQIYFIGEDSGTHFFAMEYVDGESLAELLARRGSLSVDETLSLAEQCLEGLAAAHRQGLVHRDVKPANILLDRKNNRVLLADFGLARAVAEETRLTATGMVLGTADYLSPEQGRGAATDGRSDLYSLGVLMYRLLSGRLPFEAKSATSMIFQHVYEPPPPLSDAAEVPQSLVDVVEKLMAKDPADRFQTAEEVLKALRAIRAGGPGGMGSLSALGIANPARAGKPPMPPATDSAPDKPKRVERATVGLSGSASADSGASRGTLSPAAEARPPASDLSERLGGMQGGTLVFKASTFDALPTPRLDLAPAGRPPVGWRGLFERVKDILQAHAGDALENLQGTEAQMDGALAEYERRRDALHAILREAAPALAELKVSARRHVEAAAKAARAAESATDDAAARRALTAKRNHEKVAADLNRQMAELKQQMAPVKQRLDKVEQTLEKLRSQRDLLLSRLKAARARVGTTPSRRSWIPPERRTAVATAFGLIGLVALLFSIFSPRPIADSAVEVARQPVAPPAVETPGKRATAKPLGPPPEGWGPAVELMSFTSERIYGVDFTPDGKSIIGAGWTRPIFVWGFPSGAIQRKIAAAADYIYSMAVSPDGRYLMGGYRNEPAIALWDLSTGAGIRRFRGHTLSVFSVAFSPDSRRALSGSEDGTMRLWDVETGAELVQLGDGNPVRAVAFSPDGKRALSAGGGRVLLWDLERQKQVRSFSWEALAVAFVSDTQVLSGGSDGALRLWDVETGDVIRSFEQHFDEIHSLDVSSDGRYALSGSKDTTARLWDLTTGWEIHKLTAHSQEVNSVAFSPDDRLAVTGSYDGTVRVWDLGKPSVPVAEVAETSATTTAEPAAAPVPVLLGSLYGGVAGNRYFSSLQPGTFVTLNASSGAATPLGFPKLSGEKSYGVTGVAFSSNGELFASVYNRAEGRRFGEVSIPPTLIQIDPDTGNLIRKIGELRDADGQVVKINDLAMQPGTDVLFGIGGGEVGPIQNPTAANRSARLYRIDTSTAVATLVADTHRSFAGAIAFAPDGTLYHCTFTGPLGAVSERKPALIALDPENGEVVRSVLLQDAIGKASYLVPRGLGVREDGTIFLATNYTRIERKPLIELGENLLATIDPETGMVTPLASKAYDVREKLGDIAFRPATRAAKTPGAAARAAAAPVYKLYGALGMRKAWSSLTPGTVVTLDPTTGRATPLGFPAAIGAGVGFGVTGLAFSSDDRLFATVYGRDGDLGAVKLPPSLLEINPDTGTLVRVVGPLRDADGQAIKISDLAMQPGTDVLFGIGGGKVGPFRGHGTPNARLYRIDRETAVATLVGDTGRSFGGAIAFAPDGTLYHFTFLGPLVDPSEAIKRKPALVTLDPNTGETLTQVLLRDRGGRAHFLVPRGLAVRPDDGTIFATTLYGESHDLPLESLQYNLLATIDPETGMVTPLATDVSDVRERVGDIAFRTTSE